MLTSTAGLVKNGASVIPFIRRGGDVNDQAVGLAVLRQPRPLSQHTLVPQQTQADDLPLIRCWASIVDRGPTTNQHWVLC